MRTLQVTTAIVLMVMSLIADRAIDPLPANATSDTMPDNRTISVSYRVAH